MHGVSFMHIFSRTDAPSGFPSMEAAVPCLFRTHSTLHLLVSYQSTDYFRLAPASQQINKYIANVKNDAWFLHIFRHFNNICLHAKTLCSMVAPLLLSRPFIKADIPCTRKSRKVRRPEQSNMVAHVRGLVHSRQTWKEKKHGGYYEGWTGSSR